MIDLISVANMRDSDRATIEAGTPEESLVRTGKLQKSHSVTRLRRGESRPCLSVMSIEVETSVNLITFKKNDKDNTEKRQGRVPDAFPPMGLLWSYC